MIEAIMLGLVVGIISVFTGLGGGIILVPFMPSLLGFTQLEAVATSLFVVLLNSFQLVLIANKNKLIDFRSCLKLSIGGVLAAVTASYFVYIFSDWLLKVLLFVTLVFAVILLIFPLKKISTKSNWISIFIGALGGGLSGLTGLGGGVVVGPLAYGFRIVAMKNLAPTISFVTMMFALSATLTHFLRNISMGGFWGPIQWQEAMYIFIPAFLISRILYSLQKKVPDSIRRLMLISVCVILVLKSFYSLIY